MAHTNSSLPFADVWSVYLADAQAYFPATNARLALLLLANTPLIVILINILWQLVFFKCFKCLLNFHPPLLDCSSQIH
jgi:hypothetical protein